MWRCRRKPSWRHSSWSASTCAGKLYASARASPRAVELQADFQTFLMLAVVAGGVTLLIHRPRAAASAEPRASAAGLASSASQLRSTEPAGDSTTSAAPPGEGTGWFALLQAVFPVLLAVFLFRAFIVEPYRIPTGSMVPTLAVGDYVFVSKFAYGLRLPILNWKFLPVGQPQRGDVVVFVPPHEQRYFIKRVVGLPGDRVRVVMGELYINGERIDMQIDRGDSADDGVQGYIESLGGGSHRIQRFVGMRSREGEWQVPDEAYFVLGDNRDMSEDSRYWGYVAADQIVGRAVAIWVHKPPGWSWPTLARNGVIH